MKDDLRPEYDLTKLKKVEGGDTISKPWREQILCSSIQTWQKCFRIRLP